MLTVNQDDHSGDANPGDGTCEISEGTGVCTLEAALDEADALGRAVISIDTGNFGASDITLPAPRVIEGQVTLTATFFRFEQAGSPMPGLAVDLTVAPGASLVLDGIGMAGAEASSLTVDGQLVAHRTVFGSYPGPTLWVTPTGSALVASSFVASLGTAPAFRNEGRLALQHTTAWTLFGGPVLETAASGTTSLAATDLVDLSRPAGTLCTGSAPLSLGYNSATDRSCALTGPGDRQDAPVSYDWPGPDRVDAIPVGTLGCGAILGTDLVGAERPVDGDADGTPACDIGAFEAQPAP